MASEDPTSMFADMKKKKKKPKVAFSEDPANADADPTYPPKEPIDDPSLGPTTVHERVHNNENATGNAEDGAEGANMFADLKKKKKKKDLAADAEADATPADADALDFSDLKKKKKKKEVVDSEDAPGPTGDATPLDDFSDLKKKKKKDIPMDLEDGATATPTDDFSDLKKKKKKKDIPMDFDGATEGAGAEGGEDLKKKKKKKNLAMEEFEKEFGDAPEASTSKPKKAKKPVEESDDEADGEDGDGDFDEVEEVDEEELGENPFANSGGGGRGDADEPWLDSDRDYTYDELLSRFFRLLHAQNPSLASSSSKRYTLAPPSIHRDGNKKSVFANIGDICRRMHREPQHVISFLLVEMGTTGSVDGSGRLVIKGKFQQKQIENILRRYIVEYVTCKTCKSPDTLLTKETRISFITCESCGSRQSVSAIKAGFQAQVGKRKKQQV